VTTQAILVLCVNCALELALSILAIRKRVWRGIFCLALYIFLLVPREAIWAYVGNSRHLTALWAIYFYFISDELLTFIRLLVIVEIGIRTFRNYAAVWHFSRRILAVAGSVVLIGGLFATLRDFHSSHQIILTISQYLNVMQTLLLLIVLGVALYYRIEVPQLYRSIVIGIGIYAGIQLFNSELGRYVEVPSTSLYNYIYRYSFLFLEFAWIRGLWIWSGEPPQSGGSISQAKYDDLSPRVHDRLRELNDRLSGMKKKR
jgi:hypothetical protein